ncbi:leucine-rich repeat and WD repeat-containing protein 1 [Lepeophtheirus salmonis]|uniref:Leucine-rich repeat and WD repeat-containing protein 1 WD domain-containing protein n=1 Tax=Lepeophtheirus salmonis TaxID=72036 RepID=A0A0K2TYL4_LEPSM|nr:leucine-rich repeat and WD repeat-containing protein 1-like [Lepeophtheirus salmonis]
MPDKRKDSSTEKSATKRPKADHSNSESTGEDGISYEPVHFIRSHSKNNDPADIKTQIWEVVFEPDPNYPNKTTSLVATCGGNSICIIDVSTGTVLMKYRHKELKEDFYTLAWTTLELKGEKSESEKTNILVSGGIRGEIRMFHPQYKVCFHEWRPVEKKTHAVNSLVFHSEHPTWLFCGSNDGVVSLWDIGKPTIPSYDGVCPKQLLKLFPDYGDVYNIVWTGRNRYLLAGTAAGLVGWKIEDDQVIDNKDYKPQVIDFLMPENDRDNGENPIVDSLAVASENTIVSKCALHGLIYVWDLKSTVKKIVDVEKKAGGVIEKDVTMLANLRWSDTDNFYMNLGCHKGKGLICCGDDKGTVWIYNLPQFGKDSSPALKSGVEPTTLLTWPELQDDQLENSKKVPIDRHSIIIDKVAASYDNSYIVAVTSNNMVCIWKKAEDESSNGSNDN